jgi:hypothetical protein
VSGTNANNMYNVYKFKQNGTKPILFRKNIDLNEARAICEDTETSSMTAKKAAGCENDTKLIEKWHRKQKHWFYGFNEV